MTRRWFYQHARLALIHTGPTAHRFINCRLQASGTLAVFSPALPAQLCGCDTSASAMLFTGPNRCVSYTPYGHQLQKTELPGYTGVVVDGSTHGYLLGAGYRLYNAALMRFASRDDKSPFAKGGINAYAYCEGDPVNHTDPSGHARAFTFNVPKRLSQRVLSGLDKIAYEYIKLAQGKKILANVKMLERGGSNHNLTRATARLGEKILRDDIKFLRKQFSELTDDVQSGALDNYRSKIIFGETQEYIESKVKVKILDINEEVDRRNSLLKTLRESGLLPTKSTRA